MCTSRKSIYGINPIGFGIEFDRDQINFLPQTPTTLYQRVIEHLEMDNECTDSGRHGNWPTDSILADRPTLVSLCIRSAYHTNQQPRSEPMPPCLLRRVSKIYGYVLSLGSPWLITSAPIVAVIHLLRVISTGSCSGGNQELA